MTGWKSAAGWLYYAVGLSYYFYQYFFILGLGGIVALPFIRTRETTFTVVFVITFALLVSGLIVWVQQARKRHEALNPLIDITKCIDTYRIVDGENYEYTKDMRVRARQTGADVFYSKFRWTGYGQIALDVEPSNISPVVNESADVWELAVCRFPRPLAKKEELSFILRFRMKDDGCTARPIFSKFIDDLYPNGLTMRLELPEPPIQVTRSIHLSPRSHIPIWEERSRNSGHTTIEWHLKRPEMHRRYLIQWVPTTPETASVEEPLQGNPTSKQGIKSGGGKRKAG